MAAADAVLAIVRALATDAYVEQHDALIAFVLEFAQDGFVLAHRRLPVYVPHRIAVAVFGELLEIGTFAALLVSLDADFLQSPVAGQPGITRDLREIGIGTPRFTVAGALQHLAETE